MVYGVDFNNIDVAEDVFIYIKGHTISPSESFQQATRCRNIRNLYFYGVDKNSKVDFRTLEEVEEYYRNNIDLCKTMKLMTTYYNESDEEQYLEGSFLKLYCYNTYVLNIYKSNKLKHFMKILEFYGFTVQTLGEQNRLDKQQRKEMRQVQIDIDDNLIEQYVEDEQKDRPEYEGLNDRAALLGLCNDELKQTYKDMLINGDLLDQHFSVINFARTDENINNKMLK